MTHPNNRADCSQKTLSTEHSAAYDFVDTMVCRADKVDGISPLWHGWALREAFLAGVEWRECHRQGKS